MPPGSRNAASINPPRESQAPEMAFYRQIARYSPKRASYTRLILHLIEFLSISPPGAIVMCANRISVSIIIKQRHARRLPIYIYRRDEISRYNISPLRIFFK